MPITSTDFLRKRRIAGCVALVVYSVLVLCPNVVGDIYIYAATDAPAYQVTSYSIAIWLIYLALFGNLYRACLLMVPIVLWVPIENFLVLTYHVRSTSNVIGIISETTFEESMGLLRGFGSIAALATCGVVLVMIASLRAISASHLQWSHRSRYWVAVLFFSVGVFLHFVYQRQDDNVNLLPIKDELYIATYPYIVERIEDTFPFGMPLRFFRYVEARDKLNEQRTRLASWRFGARQLAQLDLAQTHVLVIGETGRADRWAINGYFRPTSPKLGKTPNLISVSEMVSVSTHTRLSVPIILSRKSAAIADRFDFPESSLISAFKEAGFKTYWFSTQATVGHHDTPVTIHAREADVTKFLNYSLYSARTPFDDVLIPELSMALKESAGKQLIVLHTLGSHFDYSHRYPTEFEKFKLSNSNLLLHDPKHRQDLNNAYDNSILYTDYFLSEVIRVLSTSGRPVTAMWYVADHGEDLYDEDCLVAGYGRSTSRSFHVATFFWHSDGYQRIFPDKVARLRANRDGKLTTEYVFSTMLDTADIRYPGEDLSRSLLSRDFASKVRMVRGPSGLFDYDQARERSVCNAY